MNKERAEARDKLKQIATVEDFVNVLNKTMLSNEEKEILRLHYKENKSLGYIADVLCMSESSIKKKHCKILKKISKLF